MKIVRNRSMNKTKLGFAGKAAALLLGVVLVTGTVSAVVMADDVADGSEESTPVEVVETQPTNETSSTNETPSTSETPSTNETPSEGQATSGSTPTESIADSESGGGQGNEDSGSKDPGDISSESIDTVSGGSDMDGTASDGKSSGSPINTDSDSISSGSSISGSSSISSNSFPEDSTSSESKDDEEDEEEKEEVTALQIIIEGKGKVQLTFLNEDGKPADGIVSSDAVKMEFLVAKGCEVGLAAEAEKDYVFKGWKILNDTVTITDNKFVMSDDPVQITAVFRDKNSAEELSADGASPEALKELEGRPEKTNAQLIAEQHISPLPVAKADFRFWHVEREAAFVKSDSVFREETSDKAKIVARIPEDGVLFLLEDVDKDWYYAESGRARGFILKEDLKESDSRIGLFKEDGFLDKYSSLDSLEEALSKYFSFAEATVSPADNEAFLYKKCTSYPVVIEKQYALPVEAGIEIHEEPRSTGRTCGILEENSIAYVIADDDQDWVYVESGDVRGFVKSEEISMGSDVQKTVEDAGGDSAYYACTQKLKPEENKATYYTFTSVKEGTHLNPVREAIIKSAEQCLGHPYVWGGTSLLGGCDCSGFVQGLYRMYGYSIPRVAENQAMYGRQIPLDNAQPGDLIFFAQNGYVYHVALYVGNDQTIEAYDSAHGIIRNRVDHAHAVWATHVIDD